MTTSEETPSLGLDSVSTNPRIQEFVKLNPSPYFTPPTHLYLLYVCCPYILHPVEDTGPVGTTELEGRRRLQAIAESSGVMVRDWKTRTTWTRGGVVETGSLPKQVRARAGPTGAVDTRTDRLASRGSLPGQTYPHGRVDSTAVVTPGEPPSPVELPEKQRIY